MAAGAVDDDGDGRGGGRKPTFAHYKDKETGASSRSNWMKGRCLRCDQQGHAYIGCRNRCTRCPAEEPDNAHLDGICPHARSHYKRYLRPMAKQPEIPFSGPPQQSAGDSSASRARTSFSCAPSSQQPPADPFASYDLQGHYSSAPTVPLNTFQDAPARQHRYLVEGVRAGPAPQQVQQEVRHGQVSLPPQGSSGAGFVPMQSAQGLLQPFQIELGLRQENKTLLQVITRLQQENNNLNQENSTLQQENTSLQEQIQRLQNNWQLHYNFGFQAGQTRAAQGVEDDEEYDDDVPAPRTAPKRPQLSPQGAPKRKFHRGCRGSGSSKNFKKDDGLAGGNGSLAV